MATLTFHGAARQVTGSCYLLETEDNFRVLLDCGMHQGEDIVDRIHRETFAFEPTSIDVLILSHAHLDHSGLIPILVHQGFKGPIYCTEGTLKLLPIMLNDSANLYQWDLDHDNKQRLKHGEEPLEPAYTKSDVEEALSLCQPSRYNTARPFHKNCRLTFHDAGHILGSAIVEISLDENGTTKTLIFSGDLGNKNSVLMKNPALIEKADLVLMEGTYGNRNHRDMGETLEQLEQILKETWQQQGKVMIPAFAVGRTQELLFHLGCLHHEGKLDPWQIFLDSPMAIEVTGAYEDCIQLLDEKDVQKLRVANHSSLQNFLPQLEYTPSVEESQNISSMNSGIIVIAGSGMCTGGRIRHHFKYGLTNKHNTIIFTGFQAMGTLGRLLVDGIKKIRLFKQQVKVAARVETLGGFSAHAGQADLIEWLRHIKGNPRIMLIHGDEEVLQVLSDTLSRDFQITTEIPSIGDRISF